jgi:ribonuclease PH
MLFHEILLAESLYNSTNATESILLSFCSSNPTEVVVDVSVNVQGEEETTVNANVDATNDALASAGFDDVSAVTSSTICNLASFYFWAFCYLFLE